MRPGKPNSARSEGGQFDLVWAEPADAAELAAFFVANVDPNYISHSELQHGRATSVAEWAPGLLERLQEEFSTPDARIAVARTGGEVAALAVVKFVYSPACYAVLEDFVVCSEMRGRGLGGVVLQRLLGILADSGVPRVYLESGARDRQARAFFELHGFVTTSVVMMYEAEATSADDRFAIKT